jgi:hypothetical protein
MDLEKRSSPFKNVILGKESGTLRVPISLPSTPDYALSSPKAPSNHLVSLPEDKFLLNVITGLSPSLIRRKAKHPSFLSAVINAAWNNLTSNQYNQGTTLAVSAVGKFGSYEKINSTIQKCINGAAPVLLKLYPEVWGKVKVKE